MLGRIHAILGFIAACCMGTMMVITVLDASGRYLFSAPLPGAIEYISYLLAILIMSAYPLVTRERGHISVGVLAEFLRGRAAVVEQIVTGLGTLVATGCIVWFLVLQALSYQRTNRLGDVVELPLAWLAFALAALAFFASLSAAIILWGTLRGAKNSPRDKSIQ